MQWVDVTDSLYDSASYDSLEESILDGGGSPWILGGESPGFSVELGVDVADLYDSATKSRITWTVFISSENYVNYSYSGKHCLVGYADDPFVGPIPSPEIDLIIGAPSPPGYYYYSGSPIASASPFPLSIIWPDAEGESDYDLRDHAEVTLSKVELYVKDPIFWTNFKGQTEYA